MIFNTKNIRNWDGEVYDLWVHLLDKEPGEGDEDVWGGLWGLHDKNSGDKTQADEFADKGGTHLVTHSYSDHPETIPVGKRDDSSTGKTIIYNFNSAQLADLITFAEDGIVGLGFDPDCHFWNDGISFSIFTSSSGVTNAVPEPATMLLFGTGLAGLAGVARRKRK